MFKRFFYVEGFIAVLDSNNEFFINILGEIVDNKNVPVPFSKDKNNDVTVFIKSWDGLRDYRVIDLIVIHFKDLQIPKEKYNLVEAFTIDGNKQNLHAKNIGYRFKEKIESEKYKGFFHIPCFTNNVINENGVMINNKTGNFKKYYITKPGKRNSRGGYYFQRYDSNGFTCIISRHRCLCLTFKDYPDNVEDLTVNHKNGIPGYDVLDNLEWATRSENNTHAYKNDLKNQHKKVLVRDIFSGEIQEFYSINECARFFNFKSDENIRSKLFKSKFCQVFSNGKQFKLKTDERDWVIPDNPILAIKEAQKCFEICIRNCLTLEIFNCSSYKEASDKTGINIETIRFKIINNDKKPIYGFQFKKLEDENLFPDFDSNFYLKTLHGHKIKIEAKNHFSNETILFDSITEAIRELNKPDFTDKIRKGEQPLYEDGWQFKIQGCDWIEIKDIEETLYKKRRNIVAKNEVTNTLIIANNANELALILNLDRKKIRQAAMTRGNKVYNGYRIRLGIDDCPWPST